MLSAPRPTPLATPPAPARPRPRPAAHLRLGYVPLVHAAPLLAAAALGSFSRRGLRVQLSREVGWATVREKILSGELDAAQALAPMPIALSLGLGSVRSECLTALVLNLHGNTLVLGRPLWQAIDGDPARLAAWSKTRPRTDLLTFGVVYPHSTHAFVLRDWLRQANLVPDRDYRLVVVPPQQMVAHLKAGHLAGACVGEPWGSLAVRTGVGVVAALSADLAPGHPEKVLLVRRTLAESRPDEHAALIAALLEGCAWCADPGHHEDLVALFAGPHALPAPLDCVRSVITGRLDLGAGRSLERPDAVVFHGPGVNVPSLPRAAWLASHLGADLSPTALATIFRQDLYLAATSTPADATCAAPPQP